MKTFRGYKYYTDFYTKFVKILDRQGTLILMIHKSYIYDIQFNHPPLTVVTFPIDSVLKISYGRGRTVVDLLMVQERHFTLANCKQIEN